MLKLARPATGRADHRLRSDDEPVLAQAAIFYKTPTLVLI